MEALLRAREAAPIPVNGARVICAAAVPGTSAIVAATDAPELVACEDTRVSTTAHANGIACIKYASLIPNALPEQRTLVLALINGGGLHLFAYPSLSPITGPLADELRALSKQSQAFAVDTLGFDFVNESFRVAMASGDVVCLLDINIDQNKLTVLGKHTLHERVVSVAFSEMTIVASTTRIHHLLRISRGGGLAVAATVNRYQRYRRPSTGLAVGDGSVAVASFLGGLFRRKSMHQTVMPPVAFALPDNRWLLVVDYELVTFSSFGAKLEEMANVFRSRNGMESRDTKSNLLSTGKEPNSSHVRSSLVRSSSGSSVGSVGTNVSRRTFLEETNATRAERPPVATVFSYPFVLAVSGKNHLVAFAANGSVQGIMDEISLVPDNTLPEDGVRLIQCRQDRNLAAAWWPTGRVIKIELADDLEVLIEKNEVERDYNRALALVPDHQINRMINLRRILASEAREQEWHDAAIHHMQCLVNLSVRREGVDQVDLVAEAVNLRGEADSGWQADMITATLWAEFLFRLRRRVMRPSAADVHVLETLCRADTSATRVKSILSVRHEIPLNVGEALITSSSSSLREEDRVEALVALYTSVQEHEKALVLLENSDTRSSFNGVVEYLAKQMKPDEDPKTFFTHLTWLANRAHSEANGDQKLRHLISDLIGNANDSELVFGKTFEVLVEEADSLLEPVMNGIRIAEPEGLDGTKNASCPVQREEHLCETTADTFAAALLAGMRKAASLEKRKVFDYFRRLFNTQILHHPNESYHPYKLLQALQTPENKRLQLHEELAFLLGRQGRHEAAADELATELSLGPEEALTRLKHILPASDRPSAAESLISAYLRVSSKGAKSRIEDASCILKCAAGTMNVEKVLLDGKCSDRSLSLRQIQPFLRAAMVSGNQRLRMAEITQALRKSELRRLQEEVMTRKRKVVHIGHDRACALCTRRIGDSVFAAYPDGSVAHLACHVSKDGHGISS